MIHPDEARLLKQERRARIRAARVAVPRVTREIWDTLLVSQLAATAGGLLRDRNPAGELTVAAYLPIRTEPGAATPGGFLERLTAELAQRLQRPAPHTDDDSQRRVRAVTVAAPRLRILIPRIDDAQQRRLTWHIYARDELVSGPMGLLEPPATSPAYPLATADLVIVPALAISVDGRRLGQGGGFYDTALAGLAGRGVSLVAAVHPGEIVPAVPADPWDARVDVAVTAAGVIRRRFRPA